MFDEVKKFLSEFHSKMAVFSIVYRDDRGKNLQPLLDLEITPSARTEIIKNLKVTDYSEGPLTDTLNRQQDMWVFGKNVKGREVYIKITMGMLGCSVICISFHIAGYEMQYPLKSRK